MDGVKVVSLEKFKNESGNLVVAESGVNFNFLSKRIFIVTSNAGDVRGHHAHKEHSQFMMCVQGSCIVNLDNGKDVESILLNDNDKGIEVQPGVWGEQKYLEDNSTLLVLSDYLYDDGDYIRDYGEFKQYILGKKI
tara:strand:+ start:506 stop:913 length:408 start_codon:yes stop_codon:yes gene_type:complete